jgi:MEDS: MEthanogen/methylotroph, DcmR Sensory domain
MRRLEFHLETTRGGTCGQRGHDSHIRFRHLALLYTDADEFMAKTRKFIEAGLAAHEPVLVAVPGAKIGPMRAMLNGGSDRVDFLNMNELGRNPGRIIPAVREWIDTRTLVVAGSSGEPIWPGRKVAEVVEATRHEALINLAFADASVAILCPYDTARLAPSVLEDAERTHPRLVCGVDGFTSDHYTDPVDLWKDRQWPLVDPVQALVNAAAQLRSRGTARDHRVPRPSRGS